MTKKGKPSPKNPSEKTRPQSRKSAPPLMSFLRSNTRSQSRSRGGIDNVITIESSDEGDDSIDTTASFDMNDSKTRGDGEVTEVS